MATVTKSKKPARKVAAKRAARSVAIVVDPVTGLPTLPKGDKHHTAAEYAAFSREAV